MPMLLHTTFFLCLLLTSATFPSSTAVPTHFSTTTIPRHPTTNPLSPKAFLLRYWSRKIPNHHPIPPFLLSKVSPLSAPSSSLFSHAASSGSLLSLLPRFCSSAQLLCFPSLSSTTTTTTSSSSPFSHYSNSNFSNYATGSSSGLHSFSHYSPDLNIPLDTFRRYSRDSSHHDTRFSSYSPDTNVATTNFTSYSSSSTSGTSLFSSYLHETNIPDLRFSNYASSSQSRPHSFSSYSDSSNAGDQSFRGYGQGSSSSPSNFSSYAADSNTVGSSFSSYSQSSLNPNDSFSHYGFDGNVPINNFRSYADAAKGTTTESFSSYRDQANVGDDSFRSYAKHATSPSHVAFSNYGQSANIGTDLFKGYGEKATVGPTVTFKTYGPNNTFADYRNAPGQGKSSATFSDYRNTSSAMFENLAKVTTGARSGRLVNRWVEPGRFFRESQLSTGVVMPMPDIRDRMPPRKFLPRDISSRLPFSSSRLGELSRLFNATHDTALWRAMEGTVRECEREPSRGETRRCVASIEDMVDFATSLLGSDVAVRTTDSTAGSGGNIEIGRVRGIDGGRVTRSVSCHQSLFPYVVYYCHAVPKVKLYEAEIMAVGSADVINRGVAICHLDTSAWSEGHGAFVALGPGPGKIEVCHWIFEGDMTWAAAD